VRHSPERSLGTALGRHAHPWHDETAGAFRYYQCGERVVHLDGCVEVEAAYYGLPPGWIGRSVKVQWDASHMRILHPSLPAHLYPVDGPPWLKPAPR